MNTLGFTTFQNTNTLLSAVLGKIQTDPKMFSVFLSALKEDPSMQSLVESMESKCFICEGIIFLVSAPPPTSNLEYAKKTKD